MDVMGERAQEKAVGVTIRLQAVEQSDQPIAANVASVTVAQGIAYLDFGFIGPAVGSGGTRFVEQQRVAGTGRGEACCAS